MSDSTKGDSGVGHMEEKALGKKEGRIRGTKKKSRQKKGGMLKRNVGHRKGSYRGKPLEENQKGTRKLK